MRFKRRRHFSAPSSFLWALSSFLQAQGHFLLPLLSGATYTPVKPDHSYHLGFLLPSLFCLFLPKDKSMGPLNLFCGSMRVDMPVTRFLEPSTGSVVILALENLHPSGIVLGL